MEHLENQVENTEVETQEQEQPATKTYTEEEVAKMVQSEFDKKITKALETQKANLMAEFEQKLVKEKSEVEKFASMTEAEKAQKILADKEKELQEKIEALEQQQKAIQMKELENVATKALAEKELPVEFVEYIMAEDAETVMAKLSKLEENFKKAVEKAVDNKLKGSTPKTSTVKGKSVDMTKKEFLKLPHKERQAILAEKGQDFYSKLQD